MEPPPGILDMVMKQSLVHANTGNDEPNFFIIPIAVVYDWIDLRREEGFFENWVWEDTVEEDDWE